MTESLRHFHVSLRLLAILLLLPAAAWAQQPLGPAPKEWFLKDPKTDHIQGMAVDRAYEELLQGRPSQRVVVAVIDSGVDIDHEDLKEHIWINKDEIPGNGIDDDKNGYVDDVHGWNFIGGKTGNVRFDQAELTREYVRLSAKFEGVNADRLSAKKKEEYDQYQDIKHRFETKREEDRRNLFFYDDLYTSTTRNLDSLKRVFGVEKITLAEVERIEEADSSNFLLKKYLRAMLTDFVGPDGDIDSFLKDLREWLKHLRESVDFVYNDSYDPRSIVGDNYANTAERGYGNNDVKAQGSDHGTAVSAIIAASRDNDLGIRGIAKNILIMPVRAVPNGDERDKDVANAIRYAVDNGARVINMSFGKGLSPQKKAVDKAVRYAEQRGVLLVHAAGNDGEKVTRDNNFPSRYYLGGRRQAKNWLDVGASSWAADVNLPANFSNYGDLVDFFAPGLDIRSAEPDNKYGAASGTSFAAPMTSGVAALLFSYFPLLTVAQVKDILIQSVDRFPSLMVHKPGSPDEQVPFSELSKTAGVVNAYEAIKRAMSLGGGS